MSHKLLAAALVASGAAFLCQSAASALFLGDLIGGKKTSPGATRSAAGASFKFCKADEFERACIQMDRKGGQKCVEPDPLSLKEKGNIKRFMDLMTLTNKKAEAAQLIREKYMPCLTDAAAREHGVDCAVFVKERNLATCDGAPAAHRKAWEDGVRGAPKNLIDAAIDAAPTQPGRDVERYRQRVLDRTQDLVTELKKALQEPLFAVPGVDFEAVDAAIKADFKAKDDSWAKASADAAGAKTAQKARDEKDKNSRLASQNLEELESAKTVALPKAKMKNGKLAARFGKLVEKRWPGEKALKTILSSARWEVVRNKWTGIITGRVMDAHIVVQQPSGRCRLFLYGLHQSKEYKGWGPAVLNGVGESSRVLCERFGAEEGQKPSVGASEE